MGFSPVADLRHEDREVIWRYLRHPDPDTLLELLQFKTSTEKAIVSGQRQALRGLNHIGFHVENLDRISKVVFCYEVDGRKSLIGGNTRMP